MEGTPLYNILHTLEQPTPIQELNETTANISVILHTSDVPEEISIENIAPFHTIEDLSRGIWAQTDKPELFPKYSFLCTVEDDSFIPSMITWVQDDQLQIKLPNPEIIIPNKTQQDSFVEADGTAKLNTRFLPRGRVTLEDAYLSNGQTELPQFHVFSLDYLKSLYIGASPISEKDWNGLFYPYFYQVIREGPFSMTVKDEEFSKQIKTYITAKQSVIKNLNTLLQSVTDLHQLNTTNVKQLNFTWPDDIPGFEGADVLFYSYSVNEQRPYMRLLTPNTTPLTKLYRPSDFGLPYVNDINLLKTWVQDRAPDPSKNCLYIKILLRKENVGISPLYGTLMLFDEGDAHLKIQPPKDIRSLDFRTDLANLGEVLTDVSEDMPYDLQAVKLSKANLTVELDFKDTPPKNIKTLVENRLKFIESIFQPISPPEGQPKPMFMLRYKAVSNFIKEDSISEFLTYYITRKGFNEEDTEKYTQDLAREFEISEDIALEKITEYFDKKQEMTLADSKAPIQLSSSGTDISIVSKDLNTFSLHIYNLKSEQDLVRIISILSGVFLAEEDIWDEIFSTEAPADKVKTSESQVEAEAVQVERTLPASSLRFATELINVGNNDENEVEVEVKKAPEVKLAPTEKIVVEKWFIKRLQQLDNRLFGYPKEKGVSHYSSQCANNEDRYPAIFTEAQYIRMRKIYEEAEAEGKVGFILYGDPKSAESEKAALGKREKISVLRYGSDASRPNYYLCSEYYCLRDMLPVLVEDWNSDTDKPANSCPFCHGKLIVNQKDPQLGETVLRRKVKPRSRLEKRHLHIGFLGEGKNPFGYDMPCCFVSEQKLGWQDPKFKSLRDLVQSQTVKTLDSKAQDESERKEGVEKALLSRVQQLVSFDLLKFRIHKEYVLGSEKHPLEPGKIGLPNVALDNYFLQDSSLFVARSAIKQEFKPSARGMFRLGVFNRITSVNDSLFAALAPSLSKNSVQEVKKYFTDLITPRVFINLNFGNLLLEFFKPSDEEPTPDELSTWARIHLQIYKAGTEFEISRFYRSYHRFIDYINDPTKKKLLRHFVHALAEPNLLVANGLTLVTLVYEGDPREPTSTLNVKCPSLGYNIDRYEQNNVCFLTYHESGIWEPLIFINKILKKDATPLQQEGLYSITHADLVASDFPQGIRNRYLEFVTECRASFRGAYTYQQGIDVRALIPVTRALQLLTEVSPVGLVRDSYNHLIAITVRGEGSRSAEVLVPVVDDGNSFHYNTDLRIHIGLQSVELAPATVIEDLYNNFIFPYLGEISDIYQIENFLSNGNEIFGYRIGNNDVNINLPCANSDESLETEVETIEDFQFEYELNRAIIIDSRDSTYKKSPYIEQKEIIEDIYQHLRLTFSRWIATDSENSKLRTFVKNLLERNDIPAFEKIRRLEIELESTILSWLSPDTNPFTPEPVFLRSDCTSIKDPSKCTNYCSYSDGQCKIHTPDIIQIGTNKRVDATKYLTSRLFDEIIRLPARAHELLDKGVKRIQVPSTNIQIGKQWIIPQGVPAWYDLLRTTDFSDDELPQYYEEFSRAEETSEETKAKLLALNIIPIPDEIKAILPKEHVDKMGLHVVGSIALYFGISDVLNKVFNDQTLAKISNKYKKPVIQILSNETPIVPVGRSVGASSLKSSCIVIVPDLDAVLVTLDTMSDSIPGKYIKGPIYDSIQQIKARIIKLQKPVAPAETTAAPATASASAPRRIIRLKTQPAETTAASAPRRIIRLKTQQTAAPQNT